MAFSDYALCEFCDGKAIYDAEGEVGDRDVIVLHEKCVTPFVVAKRNDQLRYAQRMITTLMSEMRKVATFLDIKEEDIAGAGEQR